MLTKNFRKKIRILFCKIQKKLVPYESTRTEAYFNCHTDFVFDQNGQNALAVLSINANFTDISVEASWHGPLQPGRK